MIVAGVAVDKATLDFDKIFSYAVPENLRRDLKVGSIVLVPFGKGDKLRIGIVLQADFNRRRDEKLKYVADLKNADSRITPYTLSLIKHLKETTFCTWYEAVKAGYTLRRPVQDKRRLFVTAADRVQNQVLRCQPGL